MSGAAFSFTEEKKRQAEKWVDGISFGEFRQRVSIVYAREIRRMREDYQE